MEAAQGIVFSALSFIAVLGVVVFVHEFGHFQVARWRKVAVKSFSIGMGSEWFGWTDRHNTRWKVSTVPLGGFVSWVDDTDPTSTRPADAEDAALDPAEARRLGHFRAQPVLTRSLVVAAGPFTNFIFSILAFGLLALIVGRDGTDYAAVQPVIANVAADSAAASAGLQPGEVVVGVDGREVRGVETLQGLIAASPERAMTLTLRAPDGGRRDVTVTPRTHSEAGAAPIGRLGVVLGVRPEDQVVERIGPITAIGEGAARTWDIIARTVDYLGDVFTGQASGREIAGPVGIFVQSGEVVKASLAVSEDDGDWGATLGVLALNLLQWAAILSVAVGFVNLLPIPLLDGGHLVFYAIEAIRGGKPLPPMAQEWAFRVGLVAMASLFLFATWNDLTRHLVAAPG